MRFLLDQNVDARVGRALRGHGHRCTTVAEHNLWDARDDDLTVFACDQGAVLVTHDREFSQRRSRHVVGHHLWLRCREEEAEALLAERLDEVVQAFTYGPDVFVRLSGDGITIERRWTR